MKSEENRNKRNIGEGPNFPGTRRDDNPFKIPANYFAELPDAIQNRLKREPSASTTGEHQDSLLMWFQSLFAPRPAFAFLTMLILAGLYLAKDRSSAQADIYALTSQEITHYLERNIDELDIADFYLMDPESLDPLSESMDAENIDAYLDILIEDMDLEAFEEIF